MIGDELQTRQALDTARPCRLPLGREKRGQVLDKNTGGTLRAPWQADSVHSGGHFGVDLCEGESSQ